MRRRLTGDSEDTFEVLWREALSKMIDVSEITERDLVTTSALSESKRMIWTALLAEAATRIEAAGETKPTGLQTTRALGVALTPLLTVTRDAAEVHDGSEAYESFGDEEPARPPAPSSPRRATKNEVITAEMAEDMQSQNASRPGELYAINVGLELSKKASPVELAGGTYGSDPSLSDGLKRAVKAKAVLLRDLIGKAMENGDLLPMDRHLTRTMSRWMADPSDLLYMTAGSRLGQIWAKCKQLRPQDGRVAAYMLFLMLDEYMGRGLPKLTDAELSSSARERYSLADVYNPPTRGALNRDREEGYGCSSKGSSIPSSGSTALTDLASMVSTMSASITGRFDEMSVEQKKMSSRMERTESKMADLSQKVAGLKSGATPSDQKGCSYCHGLDHFVKDCPVLKEKRERQAAAKAAAGGSKEEE